MDKNKKKEKEINLTMVADILGEEERERSRMEEEGNCRESI